MTSHHLLQADALRRLECSSWVIIQRIKIARTVMDAIRIFQSHQEILPPHAKGLIPSQERRAKMEIFDAFHCRVNELIRRNLQNDLLSLEERKFYALNTLRNLKSSLPATRMGLVNYIHGAPNPFVDQHEFGIKKVEC